MGTALAPAHEPAKEREHRSSSQAGAAAFEPTFGMDPVLRLQRQAGNQAVQRLLRSRGIQAKLAVSNPGDPDEREAEQVADHIMRSHAAVPASSPCSCAQHGEMCEECKSSRVTLQRSADNDLNLPASHARKKCGEDYGCASCDEYRGIMKADVDREHCAGNCVAQHEQTHASDESTCCERYGRCLANAPTGQNPCREAWDTYVQSNSDWTECNAYNIEGQCLNAILIERCRGGNNALDEGCCDELRKQMDFVTKKIGLHCPNAVPALCPFNEDGSILRLNADNAQPTDGQSSEAPDQAPDQPARANADAEAGQTWQMSGRIMRSHGGAAISPHCSCSEDEGVCQECQKKQTAVVTRSASDVVQRQQANLSSTSLQPWDPSLISAGIQQTESPYCYGESGGWGGLGVKQTITAGQFSSLCTPPCSHRPLPLRVQYHTDGTGIPRPGIKQGDKVSSVSASVKFTPSSGGPDRIVLQGQGDGTYVAPGYPLQTTFSTALSSYTPAGPGELMVSLINSDRAGQGMGIYSDQIEVKDCPLPAARSIVGYLEVPDPVNAPLVYLVAGPNTPVPGRGVLVQAEKDDKGYFYLYSGRRVDLPGDPIPHGPQPPAQNPGTQSPSGQSSSMQSQSPPVQRKAADDGSPEGESASAALSLVHRESGEPLDAGTRSFFEPRFGRDFSQVRVHTVGQAAESAQAIQANAYTAGHHIVFGASQYQPSSEQGKRLLAHELTHVVQQVSSPQAPTLMREPNDQKPPVPKPGETPFNFVSESPALPNWEDSVKEMLEREFGMKFNSFAEARQHFQQYLKGLPSDAAREEFADRMRDRARKAFYRREGGKPSYKYSPEDMAKLKNGAAPESGLQLEHMEDVKTKRRGGELIKGRPERALDPDNIYVTEGGPGGTAPRGTKHAEKYRTIDAAKKSSREIRERAAQTAVEGQPKAAGSAESTPGAVPAKSAPKPAPVESAPPAAAVESVPKPATPEPAPKPVPIEPKPPMTGPPTVEGPVPPVSVSPMPKTSPLKSGLKAGGEAAAMLILFWGLDYMVHKKLKEDLENEIATIRPHMQKWAEHEKKRNPDKPAYMKLIVESKEYSRYLPLMGWMPESPELKVIGVGQTSTPIDPPEVQVEDHSLDIFHPGKTVTVTYTELLIP